MEVRQPCPDLFLIELLVDPDLEAFGLFRLEVAVPDGAAPSEDLDEARGLDALGVAGPQLGPPRPDEVRGGHLGARRVAEILVVREPDARRDEQAVKDRNLGLGEHGEVCPVQVGFRQCGRPE